MQTLTRYAAQAAFIFFLCLNSVTLAQVVPYQASGTSAKYYPATGDYEGSGVATHLGNHFLTGKVITTPTGLLTANWVSAEPQVTVAADGSILYLAASGTVELVPLDNLGNFTAIWSGEFEVVGGEGRFANAGPGDAPLQVTAVNDPFNLFTDSVWTFSWTLEGTIDLGKRGN